MLYFRMLLTMGVSLYTSRIVLNTLGVVDFGIYNVVGGVVVLFSFLNNAMTSATQRFLNIELGRDDRTKLKNVFSASITIHIIIAIIVFTLSESVGLWFINTHLNLPADRMNAVNWVFQFSILTFIISILRVPYNAIIIANERMSFYAYISILEVLLKLLTVTLLVFYKNDRLKLYATLWCIITFVISIIYKIYCNKKFSSSHYKLFWDQDLYKQLVSFSGWSIFGSIANIGKSQVINILLNIFGGVTINAAMAIANQVSSALNSFVSNFQLAFNPQIVKSYAANEKQYLLKLIFQTSRLSYFLLFLLSLPILINIDYVLLLWLKLVPKYTPIFCRLIIISLLIETISGPLWMSIQATGNIKKYQIIISSILLLNIPIAYILLKLGYESHLILWVNIWIGIIALFARILFLKNFIDLPIKKFLKEVPLNVFLVTISALPFPLIINHFSHGFQNFVLVTMSSMISIGVSIYYIGLRSEEQKFLKMKLLKVINRI
jgi:O-antigen/teichoic acid export membrane protein